MLSETLFKLGPFDFCFWNIIILSIIFLSAAIARKITKRIIKRSLKRANIVLEGRGLTWLKLSTQSINFLAVYIGVYSFKINNNNVSFSEFLDYKIIDTQKFDVSFYHILILTAIFFMAKMAVSVIKIYFEKKFRNNPNVDNGTEYVYVQIAKYIIYVFATVIGFKSIDVDLSILLGSSIGLFVGLGLGLQDVFKDWFAGMVLLFEGNLRVGDIVEISNASKSEPIVAKILKINVRTTQIETREGNVLIIPNTKLTQDAIENWSHGSELTRFRINVSVAYGSDGELVKRLLIQAAMAHPKVHKSRPIIVRLSNFGENGLDLELIFWADQSWDINNYKSEIRFEIDRLFREYKITIPYPQSTIHFANQLKENFVQ